MYSYSRLLMLCVFTVLSFTWGLGSLEGARRAGGGGERHNEHRGEHPGEHRGNEHRGNEHPNEQRDLGRRGVGGVGGLGGGDQGGAVIIDDGGNNGDNGDNGYNEGYNQGQADQLMQSYNPANK